MLGPWHSRAHEAVQARARAHALPGGSRRASRPGLARRFLRALCGRAAQLLHGPPGHVHLRAARLQPRVPGPNVRYKIASVACLCPAPAPAPAVPQLARMRAALRTWPCRVWAPRLPVLRCLLPRSRCAARAAPPTRALALLNFVGVSLGLFSVCCCHPRLLSRWPGACRTGHRLKAGERASWTWSRGCRG